MMRDDDTNPARIAKRSVVIAGHETSVSLEHAFWDALKEIARARGCSLNALITDIDAGRGPGPGPSLSGAIRVFVLRTLLGEANRRGP